MDADTLIVRSPVPQTSTHQPSTTSGISASHSSTLATTTKSQSTSSTSHSSASMPLTTPTQSSSLTAQQQETDHDVYDYYFIIIAVFVIVLVAALWFYFRTRRRRKQSSRNHRQGALLQDLDGWPSTRRWLHGNWRFDGERSRHAQEEGLDERGQAPPPYQQHPEAQDERADGDPRQESVIASPARVARRDFRGTRPPRYEETTQNSSERSSPHRDGEIRNTEIAESLPSTAVQTNTPAPN